MKCDIGAGQNPGFNPKNKEECEADNNDTREKYIWSTKGHCPDNKSTKPDKKLTWTGGDIIADGKGGWKSDCSASILSSCNVTCNDDFGGGGMFTCSYNNNAGEVCGHVQSKFSKMTSGEQQSKCESYPNCVYSPASPPNKPECKSLINEADGYVDGQPEWIGSPCYRLNNDAFSHGIYNLPLLNEVFPPLMRLLVFFIMISILLFISYKLKIFKGLLVLSKHVVTNIVTSLSEGGVVLFRDAFDGLVHTFMDPMVTAKWLGGYHCSYNSSYTN